MLSEFEEHRENYKPNAKDRVHRNRLRGKGLQAKVEKLVESLRTEGRVPKEFKKIGSGSYASVHTFSKDLVVRVEEMADESEGHAAFMDSFVMKHRSKYVPRVSYFGLHDKISDEGRCVDTYSVVVMEKLKRNFNKANEILNCEWSDYHRDYVVTNKTMKRMFKRLHDAGVTPNDMHNGNLMFRADGTPVITDPIC